MGPGGFRRQGLFFLPPLIHLLCYASKNAPQRRRPTPISPTNSAEDPEKTTPGALWPEADPHGNIRYYASGNSKRPLFMKTRANLLIVYDENGSVTGRYKGVLQKDGTIIFYDKDGNPRYKQTSPDRKISPWDPKTDPGKFEEQDEGKEEQADQHDD